MFKGVRVSSFLMSAMLATATLLASCGSDDEKKDDPAPNAQTHQVKVTYNCTNCKNSGLTDPSGEIVFLTKDGAVKHLSMVSFDQNWKGETREVQMSSTDVVNLYLAFDEVDTASKISSFPSTTNLKANIMVDGAVKRTVTVDKTTPFNTKEGVLGIDQEITVGSL